MTARVVAIIQARMGSSRLPGKILHLIDGEPMLVRVNDRVRRAQSVMDTLVATTSDGADDIVEDLCSKRKIRCFRGSQFDVLDRYYQAAIAAQADVVVRITADCPVIDPELIDDTVALLPGASESTPRSLPLDFDFAANRLPPPWARTYPIGLDVEACTFHALERGWREATEPQQREHVMPYLYEGASLTAGGAGLSVGLTPRGFRIALLGCEPGLGNYRWTVDTAEDLDFIRLVYGHFRGKLEFSWRDVLQLVTEQPELMDINAGVRHKSLSDLDERAPGLGQQ